MITRRPADERGRTRTDWLDSRHTFSFNRYYDPRYTGFRHLLVINEDFVGPGKGFGTHSHSDMEIISYVLSGALEHRDSMGNTSTIRPGEVQRMSAGTGVMHSEYNPSPSEPTHFLQIWIEPDRGGMPPSYEQREFPPNGGGEGLRLVASRAGRAGSVTVHQDVDVFLGALGEGTEVTHELRAGRHAWVQVLKGEVEAGGVTLAQGDGAAVSDEERLVIRAHAPAQILLFDLA